MIADSSNSSLRLERRFKRSLACLDRWLSRLQAQERSFTWYRLITFALGAAATGMASSRLDNRLAWLVFFISLAAFSLVVAAHRRLDERIARFTIWRQLRQEQLARMNVDWEHLPPVAQLPGERSAFDLDLDLTGAHSLHHLTDIAVSREGSLRLADWLTNPLSDPALILPRQAVVRDLAGLPRFRDKLLLHLRLVSKEQLVGSRLLDWLDTSFSARHLVWILVIGALLTALNTILFWLNLTGQIPAYWPFTLAAYILFYFANIGAFSPFLEAVVDLDRELERFRLILRHLETYPLQSQPHLAHFCAPFRDPDSLPSTRLRQLKWITAAVGLRSNQILGAVLNAALPWDFFFAFIASRIRQRLAHDLPIWLEAWYDLEALTSLANLAYLNPDYSFPEIVTGAEPVFQANATGHPLLPPGSRVCNDFTLTGLGEVMIITGSNMAGKSTFIKTIGVNLCLAYAGGPVNAASLRTRPFRLYTCMRITNSLSDGFSYFYAEVRRLKGLLDALNTQAAQPVLYLIDEIYRGTNNRERLIGSRSLVRSLAGAAGCGLIATHDLELAHLADTNPLVLNFHFRDQVQAGRLIFDYHIRPGPCTTSNALRIMALEGLPTEDKEDLG